MKQKTLDQMAELFALDHFLSEYPKDLEYNEVIGKIEEMDEDVIVWEPFENTDPGNLTEYIENLKDSAKQLIKDALGADTTVD